MSSSFGRSKSFDDNHNDGRPSPVSPSINLVEESSSRRKTKGVRRRSTSFNSYKRSRSPSIVSPVVTARRELFPMTPATVHRNETEASDKDVTIEVITSMFSSPNEDMDSSKIITRKDLSYFGFRSFKKLIETKNLKEIFPEANMMIGRISRIKNRQNKRQQLFSLVIRMILLVIPTLTEQYTECDQESITDNVTEMITTLEKFETNNIKGFREFQRLQDQPSGGNTRVSTPDDPRDASPGLGTSPTSIRGDVTRTSGTDSTVVQRRVISNRDGKENTQDAATKDKVKKPPHIAPVVAASTSQKNPSQKKCANHSISATTHTDTPLVLSSRSHRATTKEVESMAATTVPFSGNTSTSKEQGPVAKLVLDKKKPPKEKRITLELASYNNQGNSKNTNGPSSRSTRLLLRNMKRDQGNSEPTIETETAMALASGDTGSPAAPTLTVLETNPDEKVEGNNDNTTTTLVALGDTGQQAGRTHTVLPMNLDGLVEGDNNKTNTPSLDDTGSLVVSTPAVLETNPDELVEGNNYNTTTTLVVFGDTGQPTKTTTTPIPKHDANQICDSNEFMSDFVGTYDLVPCNLVAVVGDPPISIKSGHVIYKIEDDMLVATASTTLIFAGIEHIVLATACLEIENAHDRTYKSTNGKGEVSTGKWTTIGPKHHILVRNEINNFSIIPTEIEGNTMTKTIKIPDEPGVGGTVKFLKRTEAEGNKDLPVGTTTEFEGNKITATKVLNTLKVVDHLLKDMMSRGPQNMQQVCVEIATKYHEELGSEALVEVFEQNKAVEGLYYYLGAIINGSEDPYVHFKYISSSCALGQFREAERVCRDSNIYVPEEVKEHLMGAKLPDPRPLIHVCDRFDFVDELTEYLYRNIFLQYIEVYVTKVSPGKTPQVVGKLFDLGANEDFIKRIWKAVVDDLAEGVMGNDPDNQSKCMMQFCELLDRLGDEKIASSIPSIPMYVQSVIDAGVVPRFVAFLKRYDNPALQTEAAWALMNIQLPTMVEGVMGNDPAVQTECTTQFRRLLSIEKNPPIQNVIDTGVVPRFVEFLQRDDNPVLQWEAACALTNIASGTHDHTKVVMEVGAVPIFVRLLSSPDDDVSEQAVLALGNIANSDSPSFRDLVLQAAVMPPLLKHLHPNTGLSMLRNATWTLSHLCSGKPLPDFEMVQSCLPTLSQLISPSTDVEVLTDACRALTNLLYGPNENKQAVIETGVCRQLVWLLSHSSQEIQTAALSAVGNIAMGNDSQRHCIIDNHALPYVWALLSSPQKYFRQKVCWIIFNMITAGNKKQILDRR